MQAEHDDSHDDSGIGMSLMDDSPIDLHKFDMPADAPVDTKVMPLAAAS